MRLVVMVGLILFPLSGLAFEKPDCDALRSQERLSDWITIQDADWCAMQRTSRYALLSATAQRAVHNIQMLIETSSCTFDTQCKAMPIGSKGCGGPNTYAIYPTTLAETVLAEISDNAKKLFDAEEEMNTLGGFASDCAYNTPPEKLVCRERRCLMEGQIWYNGPPLFKGQTLPYIVR